jgi:hypothetical protein
MKNIFKEKEKRTSHSASKLVDEANKWQRKFTRVYLLNV